MLGRGDKRQRRRRLAAAGAAGVAVKRHHDAKVAADQEATSEPAGQTEAETAVGGAGGLSEESLTRLKELGELHEQNVLSDEEFEQEKAKLLDSQ
jgi:Short C-terminal domain